MALFFKKNSRYFKKILTFAKINRCITNYFTATDAELFFREIIILLFTNFIYL